jgi:tetratricopeptide (TPR) repeat protein
MFCRIIIYWVFAALSIIFGLLIGDNIYSQDSERYLEIRGNAEINMKPASRVTVNLYEGNTKVKTVKTRSDGSFSFKLDMNKDYTVEVTKEGYVHKKIRFITKIPDEELGIWVREFAIGLVEHCEGVNYSVLDEPVDVIKYSVRKKDFDSDKTFVFKMKQRLENLLISVDQCKVDTYSDHLDKADKLYKEKKYEEARQEYESALDIFPDEKYPSGQISKINTNIGKDKNIENLYNKTIADADALFAQQRYDEALLKYKGALTLKPQETHSKQKISEIESIRAKQEAEKQAQNQAENEYNILFNKANAAVAAQNYALAKQYYSQAAEIKPDNIYTSSKIREMDVLIAKKTQDETKQKEVDKEFDANVMQADNLVKTNNLEQALEVYKKALLIKPNESYPLQKIAEIEQRIKNQQEAAAIADRAAADREYQAALAQGDNSFRSKDYEAARTAYNKALSIKPDELYPKQRLDRINKLIASEEARKLSAIEEGYNQAVSAGNSYLTAQQYNQAKQEFQKALTFKSNDVFSKNKIAEIDRLIQAQAQRIASENEKKEQYQAAVKKANGLFQMKEYEAAKKVYQEALLIKSDEQYPRTKIQEIDRLLAMETARKQREIDAGYKSAITQANDNFNRKLYEQAKSGYEKALSFKPDDMYSKNRISEIDRIILQEQQRLASEKTKKNQYDALITKADAAMKIKDYANARVDYERASQLYPQESYARQKIMEINRLIQEQEKALADKQARDNRYNMAISKADGFFRIKQYDNAKTEYKNALMIKPDEEYPKNRISEIDRLINAQLQVQADAKAREDAYNSSVGMADNLFAQKKYEDAKVNYNKALGYKPDASYPAQQIAKINDILAKQKKIRLGNLEKDREYNSYIALADKAFDAAEYTTSKEYYQKSLNVKPNELYPKQKIARIDEILKLLAKQKTSTSSQTTSQSSTPRKTGSGKKLAELNFKNDSERDMYLADLKRNYPEGITLETYEERYKTTKRYVIIRKGQAQEFRMVHFTNWGGREYSVNGKPITAQYFESQTSRRTGEYFKEFKY